MSLGLMEALMLFTGDTVNSLTFRCVVYYKKITALYGLLNLFLSINLSSLLSPSHTKGAFSWDYSGIGILGIDGICALLGAIPFSE